MSTNAFAGGTSFMDNDTVWIETRQGPSIEGIREPKNGNSRLGTIPNAKGPILNQT